GLVLAVRYRRPCSLLNPCCSLRSLSCSPAEGPTPAPTAGKALHPLVAEILIRSADIQFQSALPTAALLAGRGNRHRAGAKIRGVAAPRPGRRVASIAGTGEPVPCASPWRLTLAPHLGCLLYLGCLPWVH